MEICELESLGALQEALSGLETTLAAAANEALFDAVLSIGRAKHEAQLADAAKQLMAALGLAFTAVGARLAHE